MVLPSVVERSVNKWPVFSHPAPLPLNQWNVVPPVDDISAVSWAAAIDDLTQACRVLAEAPPGKHFQLPPRTKEMLGLQAVNSREFSQGLAIILTDLSFEEFTNRALPQERDSKNKKVVAFNDYLGYCRKLRSIAFKTRLTGQLLKDASLNSQDQNRLNSIRNWQGNLEQLEVDLAGRGMVLHSGYQTNDTAAGLVELEAVSALTGDYHKGEFRHASDEIQSLFHAVAAKITHGTGGRYNLAESLREARRKIKSSYVDSCDLMFGQGELTRRDLILSGKRTGIFNSVSVKLLEYPGTNYVQPVSVFDNSYKVDITTSDPVLVFSNEGNLMVGSDNLPVVIMDKALYVADRQGNKIPVKLYSFDNQNR